MSTDICEVIITADDPEWLAAFTRTLVDERLAACGQNLTAIRSIYPCTRERSSSPASSSGPSRRIPTKFRA